MDYLSEFPTGKSPRRELQGPRPTPLKVRKESHKIKKPPIVPNQQSHLHQQQHRPPIIIYTVSPKVIHANPNEFMTLVQRLTGSDSTGKSTTITSSLSSIHDNNGGISPAARFASLEKTKAKEIKKPQNTLDMDMDINMSSEGVEISVRSLPGILSPGPNTLQPIPHNFFSPPSDPNPQNFCHDLSPVLHTNRNYFEGNFLASPSNLLSSHILNSPTPSLDIFNNFFDLWRMRCIDSIAN